MASITLKPPGKRSTVQGGGKRRLVIGSKSREKRAPTEADALFCNRIGAYCVLSPVVGDSVLGWFTVTSTCHTPWRPGSSFVRRMRPSASLNLDVAGGDLVFVGGEGGQDFGLFPLRDLEEIEGPSELRCDFTKFCTFPEEQKTHIFALVDRHIEEAVNEVWPAMALVQLTLPTTGVRR